MKIVLVIVLVLFLDNVPSEYDDERDPLDLSPIVKYGVKF